MIGKTVALYLVDGSPTGLMTAQIGQWTGHLLVSPRSRLADALSRPESNRTGVYFLVGDDPEQVSRSKVYIGEADVIRERLKSHASDTSKEFWTHVYVVTSSDDNLNKAHVRYLESRFIQIAKEASRANLANGNEPGERKLAEGDVANMEYFIYNVQVLMPVVGQDFLRPKPTTMPGPADAVQATKSLELILKHKEGAQAQAVEEGGEITVISGSTALKKSFEWNQYEGLRKELIDSGVLVDRNSLYQFSQDYTFSSPSAAAAVVLNRNANGRTEWKVKATGVTLKEWQDAQL